MRKTINRIVCIIFVCLFVSQMAIAKAATLPNSIDSNEKDANFVKNISYSEYYDKIKSYNFGEKEIILSAEDISAKSESIKIIDNYEGYNGKCIDTPEGSFLEWKIYVDKDTLYNIVIDYYPIAGRGNSIERELYINDEIPFESASHINLERIYKDNGSIYQDNRNNDIRPSQIESPKWMTKVAEDYLGYYQEPFLFKLNKGENSIKLVAVREQVILGRIRLTKVDVPKPYEQVKTEYEQKQLQEVKDEYLYFEAEKADEKSDPTLYPISDRTSPATSPYKGSKISLNTIGGVNWKIAGQKISWKFNVNKAGLYKIALKERQNFISGGIVSRKLYLDGVVPFAEMNNIEFSYANEWANKIFSNKDNEPYFFYLSEGEHTLTLEVNLGNMASIIRSTEESVYQINYVYRKILMITGTNPDIYADYKLNKVLPNEIKILKDQSEILYSIIKDLVAITGKKGSNTAILERIAYQLSDFYERPDTIPERFSTFKDNITALSSWLLTASEQPLELDYIVLYGSEAKLPEPDVNIFGKMLHEFKMFIYSFTEDYNSIGNVEDAKSAISVWISTGRDQAQIIKNLIDESFTPINHIPVNLRLVQPGSLLPAVVAGIGPDVSLQVGESEPMNYALRGAVVNLAKFEDFDSIKKRFNPQSFIAYTFNDGIFALPETTTFPMLFYRKDILYELGINIPQTWEDIYNILPILQKNHMNFYMPVSLPNTPGIGPYTFYTLLYQIGGDLYSKDNTYSRINEEKGINAFRMWTELYSNYKLPVVADFANRFRIGEVPIGIQDYSMYNMLSVFAPEIRGLWDFAPVPGIKQPDGTINRTVASGGLSCMLMSSSKEKENSWEVMKWWTNTQTQVQYGREMESLMGAAARYPTANLEAFSQLPWSYKEYQSLLLQWKSIKGVPQIPGSYFTPRHLDNAFRSVVYNGSDSRETLYDYVKNINDEITAKRKEFGLPTS